MTLEVSMERIGKDAQNNLEKVQRLQQEYQMLKTEKTDLKVSYENMNAEKDQLQSNIVELEAQKATIE